MKYNILRFALALALSSSTVGALVAQKGNVEVAPTGKPVGVKPAVGQPLQVEQVGTLPAASQPVKPGQPILSSQSVPTPRVAADAKPKEKSRFDGQNGLFIPEWWQDGMQVNAKGSLEKWVKAPWFKGASLDADVVNLPYYDLQVPVGKNESVAIGTVQPEGVLEVSGTMFQTSVTDARLSNERDWYPASHIVPGEILTIKGQDFQQVRIYPILVSTRGDRYRRADRISYTISKRPDAQRRGTATAGGRMGYVTESALRNGAWYKMGVTSEGIYQLDYSFFSGLGVDPSTIDPRTVKVYGNGGAALPQVAGTYPYDDIEENAILAQGESDGSFDNGDYFAFYSAGLGRWENSDTLNRYTYFPNFYTDTTFYFVTWGSGAGKRVQVAPTPGSPNHTPTYSTKFGHYEDDKFNSILSGRLWMGERFDLTTTQNFNFSLPAVVAGSNVKTTVRVGARSNNTASNFAVKEGGTTFATLGISATINEYGSTDYYGSNRTFNIPSNYLGDGQLNLELTYSKPTTSSVGFLDYIEYEYQQQLDFGNQPFFTFTATDNVGPGQVFAYQFGGASTAYQVWDVTDPLNAQAMSTTANGSTLSFAVNADSIKHMIAFNGTSFKRPVNGKSIPNQNLHGLGQTDFLIITHPAFGAEAERLAAFHRDHYQQVVHVVHVGDIYNEFSSGAQDPTAIRDFVKMFYDRGMAGANPTIKYVLIVGDGSYDYKHIQTPAGSNYVATYQSRRSQLPTGSYSSDDYYGFLDDGEGFWGEQAHNQDNEVIPLFLAEGDISFSNHGLDVAVGRLPVTSAIEAGGMVDKIIAYHDGAEGFGPWRNRVLLAADHKDIDGNTHATQADSYTTAIVANAPCANIDKIYMDNYVMENQASGDRFPDGKAALLKGLDEGSLLVNYTGHGGEVGWSNAQILDVSDINKIDNGIRCPAYITATCEFGRWDDPARKSGAEILLLRPDGGSIAMFTTVRVVFSGPNFTINSNYYDYVFDYDQLNGRWPTMGEIFERTKNVSWGGSTNNRNFSLLGDPAMQLAYPEHKAVVTSINGIAVSDTVVDTLGALNLITITGEARDVQDNLLSNYNGDLYITVFDKASKFHTRRRPFDFVWQKNRVFKGSSTVQNGLFSFQFVVPVDISYEDQLANLNGKISLYFNDLTTDGGGCNGNIFIGGTGAGTIVDDRAPELDLFLNDIKFADGGLVDENPVLLAEIFDQNGINTVGTGIGHELTGILDNDESNVYVLNDYYEASQSSYREGTIRYPFKDLSVGEHNLRVKVWDVANNSRESDINFVVAENATMALGHVLNYPNPFTTNTKFFIEHNRNGSMLNVLVKVYTVSGKLVKTLQDNIFADGNLYCDLEWDGTDDYGDLIGRGVYVYQVIVRDEGNGERVSTFEKLVLLR
jgi:Peptidase family C25